MKYWMFREYNEGKSALFKTREAAEEFKKKANIRLLEDDDDILDNDISEIWEVELNPDFDAWWNEIIPC